MTGSLMCPHCGQLIEFQTRQPGSGKTALEVMRTVCLQHGVDIKDISGRHIDRAFMPIRAAVIKKLRATYPQCGTARIAAWLGTSVDAINYLKRKAAV